MENGKCFRCKYFNRYYIKQVKRFEKTKLGWCSDEGKTADAVNCCDKFVIRKPKRIEEGTLKYYLSDLLTEISELRKAVEAELSENEELQDL